VEFLGLSGFPHYATLQKAAARLRHGMLLKILESFVAYCQIVRTLAGMDATGLSYGQASYYYTKVQAAKEIRQDYHMRGPAAPACQPCELAEQWSEIIHVVSHHVPYLDAADKGRDGIGRTAGLIPSRTTSTHASCVLDGASSGQGTRT